MSVDRPLIGIALAAYQPKLASFREQLASLQKQTYPSWFCVVTLDSPLAPLRAAPELADFFADRRFEWRENPTRLGHKRNFEGAIQATLAHQPRWIACSDQDDVWYPEKLAREAQRLETLPPLSLTHCDMHVMQADGSIDAKTAWQTERRGVHHAGAEHLIARNVVAGCAMLMDAELARRYPRIPEAFDYHDHWYAVVAACLGVVDALDEPLFAYRQHGGNVVGVTEFPGVLAAPPGKRWTPGVIVEKCRATWRKSRARAEAAMAAGVPLPMPARELWSGRGAGVRLLGMAARSYATDPALTRALLGRAVGSWLG